MNYLEFHLRPDVTISNDYLFKILVGYFELGFDNRPKKKEQKLTWWGAEKSENFDCIRYHWHETQTKHQINELESTSLSVGWSKRLI